ncbi:MAG: Hsp20/alpha crystallin family protein [Chitinophaga sp.]|uniref:Hsp20/alpha crystallin family protein n=1 Tax=Chitinophaga sp. TaxID=1869181 RepID=UPI0025BBAF3D|nr:Hsp20/alpha crystallin family protein [Chitinophaga sp.]MBV8252484.1 Hsp20/alpha crystallin family protein [Chitinophaga sp.]
MTHVTFGPRSINGLVGDILTNGWNKVAKDDFLTNDYFTAHPPVNITETKEGFVLDVVAPGFNKEDFKINADAKALTISAEKQVAAKDENEKQVRREFSFKSFKRSFTISEAIDTAKIAAKYENGILKVTLPKKENTQEAPKSIVVE